MHQTAMRLATLALALGLSGLRSMVAQTGLTSLEQLKNSARVLLIFAPRPDDPRLEIQVRTLQEHAAEAHERDLVVIALPYNNPSPTPAQLTPDEATVIRRRFHIAPEDFTVVLIGKDGGSKLQVSKPISMRRLDETIDSMPMRQDEIRK